MRTKRESNIAGNATKNNQSFTNLLNREILSDYEDGDDDLQYNAYHDFDNTGPKDDVLTDDESDNIDDDDYDKELEDNLDDDELPDDAVIADKDEGNDEDDFEEDEDDVEDDKELIE